MQVTLSAGHIAIKGGKGTGDGHPTLKIKQDDNVLTPARDGQPVSCDVRYYRALVNNMVTGVSAELRKEAAAGRCWLSCPAQGQDLSLSLGSSHPVKYICQKVSLSTAQTEVVIMGIDKQLVGQVAAEIRDFRRPEPYKVRVSVTLMKWFAVRKPRK